MPKGKERHIFPTWRTHWSALDGISQLLESADLQMTRRSVGNHRMPKWTPSLKPPNFDIALLALRAWANGEPPKEVADRQEVARRIHDAIWPVMQMVVWPRWLHLEYPSGEGRGVIPTGS